MIIYPDLVLTHEFRLRALKPGSEAEYEVVRASMKARKNMIDDRYDGGTTYDGQNWGSFKRLSHYGASLEYVVESMTAFEKEMREQGGVETLRRRALLVGSFQPLLWRTAHVSNYVKMAQKLRSETLAHPYTPPAL